ncbi:MAG: hypothetical protein IPK32_12705 [Verrucomicrobiaceae bacterium]|nr:hypothetical protein [Verrucomicrobiaceae bacterium]
MATRLDTAIVRGEIDNTEQGRTHGLIWLLGRAEPLRLDLEGDAWRDVAGTRITFHHSAPKRQRCVTELSAVQCGIVGDITASRKVKNITASDEEINRLLEADLPLPFEWQNSLYIEWFSEADGRVIIELAGCEVQITDFAWQMDEAEEQAQQFANMNAMRNWLETIIQRPESTAQPEEDAEGGISFGEDSDEDDDAEAESVEPMSEESWEASLKHSDRLTEAHMEAIDKYSEDDDSEEKIAFVMGWDHLLDMMAFESEQDGPADQAGGFLVADENEDDDAENEDWK